MLSQTFIDTINKLATGTSYPAVTNNIILEQSIVLAPVNEQNRIVEKIEEFFSELDQVIKGLKKAHQLTGMLRLVWHGAKACKLEWQN